MRSRSGEFRPNGKSAEQNSVFRGLFFGMLSGVFFSLVSVLVKQMKNLHPGQLALYRFVATFFIYMPEIVKIRCNPLGPPKFRFLIVLRGIVGSLSIFLNFVAFRYLSLGEASVIIFSSPVVVTIFARVFFKEPCGILQSISVLLTLIGIVFTTKLPSRLTEIPAVFSSDRIFGLLAAIFSVFNLSAMQLIVRKIRTVPQSVINFNYSWVGILLIACLTAIVGDFQWQQCGIQSLYILLLSLFSICGLTLVVWALQCEYAGPVTTVRAAADIALAFLWQILIFQDVPDAYGIIGAVFVSVSIILIGLGKWLASNQINLFSCEKFKRNSN